MYPTGCKTKTTKGKMSVYMDGIFVVDASVDEGMNYGFIRRNWLPGKYTVLLIN